MLKHVLFIILTALTIASCSTNKQIGKQKTQKSIHKESKGKFRTPEQNKLVNHTNKPNKPISKKKTCAKHKLEKHFKKYKAVPYKYGGTSIKGFDCSGFVQFTYKSLFNINLPRTTWHMLKEGVSISKKKLQVGDLVLFKTSKHYRHVGIFMGDNLFIHVSTKKGLMKSSLNNPYWIKHYLTSRRVF